MQHKPSVWLDANISPAIALWLNDNFDVEAKSCYILGLNGEKDIYIFKKAKQANVIFITKDKDFSELLTVHKSPPKIILLNSGNISNAALKETLSKTFKQALDLLVGTDYEVVHIS